LADTLSKLRTTLADDKALQVTQGFLSINRQVVEVDWLTFCDLRTEISRQPGAFLPNQSLSASLYQKMSTLVRLWNSRELIASDEVAMSAALDAWLADLRLGYTEFLMRVLLRLGQHETLAGYHDRAITWLELARKLNQYDDSLNEALLDTYLHAQRYAEAQAFYMELKALYETGMDADLPLFLHDLEPRLAFVHPSANPVDHPNWSIQPGLSVPFIGQEAALTDLKNYSNRGGGVIVIGDGGSGKTRLVYEFCRQMGAGSRLLVATCQPLQTGMPFAPWIGLLRASILESDWR